LSNPEASKYNAAEKHLLTEG